MKYRLRLIGYFVLMVIISFLCLMITILLAPIWAIVWIIYGWWLPKEVFKWLEDNFPEEVTS